MRKWVLLSAAIATEVTGTLSLRASQDHSAWLAVVVVGYVSSFILMAAVLRAGMPVGVAYGIWGAIGTAVTAAAASVIFGEAFTWSLAGGIALIIAGVLLVEFGSHERAPEVPA
ncbi:cation transporter [Mycobacterium sp. Root265]|uniref:DMT family transporter n=1 Tax=Mycobacterium sp. Root265 TaxID=1736504 RepID=UPI00070B34F1|nr:SMR family transporter [Mycobacterium sp. Root265]KRD19237.1 cation transporter [Mycobacterium sp. Root265]